MKLSIDEKKAILKARADALSCEPLKSDDKGERIDLIEFSLGGENYAFESAYVREACALKELTPLPCTPQFVLGIFNLRGRIFSAIDIKRFFGLPSGGITNLNKVIIAADEQMEIGILADEIAGARKVPISDIQAPLPTSEGIRTDYIKGITMERVIILDAAKILSDKKLIVHEEVES